MTNITLLRAELQQVLEAMENFGTDWDGWHRAYMALRDRLAQPEQEPVAFSCLRCVTPKKCAVHGCCPNTWPAEAPPQRKPLTKDEIRDGARKTDPAGEDLCSWSFERGVRFAEDAHGINVTTQS